MRPLAYTYEAAAHCVACATARFGGAPDNGEHDREGNPVGAIFVTDSDWFADAARVCERATLACDTCLGVIACYDPEHDIESGPCAP